MKLLQAVKDFVYHVPRLVKIVMINQMYAHHASKVTFTSVINVLKFVQRDIEKIPKQ